MEKDFIEVKLDLIETRIKDYEELYKFSNKANKIMLIVSILTLIGVAISYEGQTLSVLQIFSISTISHIICKILYSLVNEKHEYAVKQHELEIEKIFCLSMLNEKKKENK